MIAAEPYYKLLYEQSQKLYEQSLQNLALTQQKLLLALLDANELRRKLFGIKSHNRVKKGVEGQLDMFPLEATEQDLQASEELTVTEVEDSNLEQDQQAEKRKKAASRPRMVLPPSLEREEIILDPEGDLSDYKVIGEKVTEVLVMVPASFTVRRIMGSCQHSGKMFHHTA